MSVYCLCCARANLEQVHGSKVKHIFSFVGRGGGGRLRIKFYRLTVAFNFSSLLLVIDPEIMSTMSLLS